MDIFTSGTLHYELWAFDTPWNGSFSQPGYFVADHRLGTLLPFYSFFDVDVTVLPLMLPPPGVYYPTLFATEYFGPILAYQPVE